MRVISGKCKRKKLFSVPGANTRPTSDRTRESMFNILSHWVRDAVVLDLFAGTGALGIEALSRGAKSAHFIEQNRAAVSVIKRNMENCNLEAQATVIPMDIRAGINRIRSLEPPFDLVFMDPPYGRDLIGRTLSALAEAGCLAEGATVVVEHAPEEEVPGNGKGFVAYDSRKYGKTRVTFLTYDSGTDT